MVDALIALVLLTGNGFFVAVEFAIARTRPTMVEDLVRRNVRGAGSLKHGVDHIDNYLSACQLGITICSIGLGITAEPLLSHAFEDLFGDDFELLGLASTTVAFILAYGLVSMAHVVLGELSPKSLAIARTRTTGLALMPIMRVFYVLTKPLVDFFNYLGNAVLRPFGVPPASEAAAEPHSEAELKALIAESERRGLLDPEEMQFAHGAFSFGDSRAREVMVPRSEVAILRSDMSLREATAEAATSGHRRLPLCGPDGDLDQTIGYLNLNDLAEALAADSGQDPTDLARELFESVDGTLLDDLLEQMREQRQEIALIRDEHGTAVGVITLEDVIEQILGDIRDEFDPPRERGFRRTEDGVEVDGSARVEELREPLALELGAGRAATIGGWLIERHGSAPEVGETAKLEGWCFEVLERDGPRIARLLIRRDADSDNQPDD